MYYYYTIFLNPIQFNKDVFEMKKTDSGTPVRRRDIAKPKDDEPKKSETKKKHVSPLKYFENKTIATYLNFGFLSSKNPFILPLLCFGLALSFAVGFLISYGIYSPKSNPLTVENSSISIDYLKQMKNSVSPSYIKEHLK